MPLPRRRLRKSEEEEEENENEGEEKEEDLIEEDTLILRLSLCSLFATAARGAKTESCSSGYCVSSGLR